MKKSFRIGRKSVAVLPKEKKEAMEGQNRRISEIGFLSNRRWKSRLLGENRLL